MEPTPPKELADEQGISFGRYLQARERFGKRLVYGGERNMLLFGPNGSGKGTRFLMPNLLQMQDCSIVVVDPKGELAAVTAPYRRRLHGDDSVVIINPFGVLTDMPGYEDLKSAGYNPLRTLDPRGPTFNSDAAWLTDGLIPIEGHDPHWSRSARKLVSGLIMYARLLYGQRANLAHVRGWLTEQTVQPRRAKKDDPGAPGRGIPQTAHEMMTLKPENGISAEVYAALRMRAAQFTRWDSREVDSIISTADTQTEALDDAPIATDLKKPGLDFRELKKRPMTVYIILPPDMMARQERWLRMLISSALRALMKRREPGEQRVFFLMDEFAALGRLEIIDTTWALVRGYGIQLVPIFQDLNQLEELYKERWQTFIGMAGVIGAFGPNDLRTADWLSQRSGDATETVLGYSESLEIGRQNQGINYHQAKVPRMTPHELFDTPEGHVHIWLAGMANRVPAYMPAYYEIAACRERARDNPYYAGGEATAGP